MSRSQSAMTYRHTADASPARVQRNEQSAGNPDHAQPALPSNQAIGQALGSGTALDPAVRAEMEARFGESFADVRIHDHPSAHATAQRQFAQAFTSRIRQ
jgi:hypothetical protein